MEKAGKIIKKIILFFCLFVISTWVVNGFYVDKDFIPVLGLCVAIVVVYIWSEIKIKFLK